LGDTDHERLAGLTQLRQQIQAGGASSILNAIR
jgi:hypothetical protein